MDKNVAKCFVKNDHLVSDSLENYKVLLYSSLLKYDKFCSTIIRKSDHQSE